jgi:hypothetical protein
MLAHGQVPADDYDPESDDETLNARRTRLIPVKVERIPIARAVYGWSGVE